MPKIEIIAIGTDKIYSVGSIEIKKKGDVYMTYKIKQSSGFHLSRHRSGKVHWKAKNPELYHESRSGMPIENFSGVEKLCSQEFSLKMLPVAFREYKMKSSDGIFAIDMRSYKNRAFNLVAFIFTDEGIGKLFKMYKDAKKKQIYLYTDCHPKIALVVLDSKK